VTQDKDRHWDLVNTLMSFRVSDMEGIFLSGYTTIEFSGSSQVHGVIEAISRACYCLKKPAWHWKGDYRSSSF
jgi:hypothetical protein